jgi:membrane-bound metal-dependent hydrolase YbcI (DUF457 family)
MKGVVHYLAALSASALLPGNLERAASGNPWPILVGGIAGILPDLLDFKIGRYLAHQHAAMAPDPLAPDPALICQALTLTMQCALQQGSPHTIQLHTIQTGAGHHIPYQIDLSPADRTLSCTIHTQPHPQTATVPLPAPIHFDYYASIAVTWGDGPAIQIAPAAHGSLAVRFLPWHRSWSHSLLVPLIPAGALMLIHAVPYGLTWMAGWYSHIALDQLGNLGCNMMWPFTRTRTTGRGIASSDSRAGNAIALWSACLLLLVRANAACYTPPFSLPALIRLWLIPIGLARIPKLLYAIRQRRA